MPFASHRSAEARNFDCVYDPNYILPGAKDARQARNAAINRATPTQMHTIYAGMFEDGPKEKRVLQRKRAHAIPASPIGSETSSFVDIAPGVQRLVAGADAHVKNVHLSPSECKTKSCSQYYHKPNTNVNVVNVRLSDSKTLISKADRHIECKYFGEQAKRRRTQTRGTQTLYRESSAQTLAYLPDVSNGPESLDLIEVFRLPTILPGDGPPGLYEVEVLERARKRWSFNKALKINLRRQIEAARELAKELPHKIILQAFEWERWIEREEHIQECQMLRLEIVIRMFDAREREMHETSKTRLEKVCERIAAERAAGLRKNEVEFQRDMRRLEVVNQKVPRNWRKTTISSQLGDPSSEFYGPQMRYGVNPGRRNFKGNRKAFDARMDDLEKRAVNMNKLECPYAKLKQWSKPKERVTEAEQNFCSDENLKKLYENLKSLREFSSKQKKQPKCLIEKFIKPTPSTSATAIVSEPKPFTWDKLLDIVPAHNVFYDDEDRRWSMELHRLRTIEEIADEAHFRKARHQTLMSEMHDEEMEAMLSFYEGTSIGWLMRFLAEEMSRLQEQRKLHYITMLAQKERWRREAMEAGLRQKENDMRIIYEKLYKDTFSANEEICQSYLDEILKVDARAYADETATDYVTAMARIIDEDIARWIKSFQVIQNPQNYNLLRHLLKDLIFPSSRKLREAYEAQIVVEHVIECVLFPNVYKLLEPHDISFSLAEETTDRLIDTDLYYFTPEQSSECECCEGPCNCNVAKNEAKAIMRKVIRYSVPGRRWCTEDERIGIESVNDLLDDVFEEAKKRGSIFVGEAGIPLQKAQSHQNLICSSKAKIKDRDESAANSISSDSSDRTLEEIKTQIFESKDSLKREQSRVITKSLNTKEKLTFVDPDSLPPDDSIMRHDNYGDYLPYAPNYRELAPLRNIPSTYDMISINKDFFSLYDGYDDYDYDDDDDDRSIKRRTDSDTSKYSMLMEIFGGKKTSPQEIAHEIDDEIVKFILQLIHNVAEYFIPREENDSIDSFFDSPDVSTFESKMELVNNLRANSDIFDDTQEPEDDATSTSYELEIDELELGELLTEGCKCQEEIERLELVKRLQKTKKLKVIKHTEHAELPSNFFDTRKTAFITPQEYKQWTGKEQIKKKKGLIRSFRESIASSRLSITHEVEPYMQNLFELVMQDRNDEIAPRPSLSNPSLKTVPSSLSRLSYKTGTRTPTKGTSKSASLIETPARTGPTYTMRSPSVQFHIPIVLSNLNTEVLHKPEVTNVIPTHIDQLKPELPEEKPEHAAITVTIYEPTELHPVGILRTSNSGRLTRDSVLNMQSGMHSRTPSVQFTHEEA